MKLFFCLIFSLVFIIAAQKSAFASTTFDTLDCSGGLVSLGDFATDVLNKCGQPAYSMQREQKLVDGDIFGYGVITSYIIDDWTFNFGPSRFQYRLLLRNGKLWRIESMGYGY
jgi:hypothetical protein